MLSRLRPSPAMMVACIALVAALGGSAYAATQLPPNSVDTAQLKNGAVTTKKLHDGAVTSAKVKQHSLLAKDFEPGQLPPGLKFTTGSGTTGPTLSKAGTYFVVVKVGLPSSGKTALTGDCFVQDEPDEDDSFYGAFVVPTGASKLPTVPYSFAGMLTVTATETLNVSCNDASNNPVTPSPISWWVAPVSAS